MCETTSDILVLVASVSFWLLQVPLLSVPVCPQKWSDLLHIKTKIFLDGPSISRSYSQFAVFE